MIDIVTLLNQHNSGVLVTSQNNRPHGRPQHIHLIKDGKFYFTTNNLKKAYAQIKENPYIEFVVTTPELATIRISGKVQFTHSLEEKQMVIDHAPLVKKGYGSADNPIFEVFYLSNGEGDYFDLRSGKPAETFTF